VHYSYQLNHVTHGVHTTPSVWLHDSVMNDFGHVTPLLHDLHWLRKPERITFRLAVLA